MVTETQRQGRGGRDKRGNDSTALWSHSDITTSKRFQSATIGVRREIIVAFERSTVLMLETGSPDIVSGDDKRDPNKHYVTYVSGNRPRND